MVPNGWKLSTIEEIANVSSGGTPSRKNVTYWNGNIPWVTTAEVQFKVIKDTSEKITEEGLANSSAKLFPVDTILMAMYGQGKTRGQVAKLGIEASTNQACAAIVLHTPDYEVDYYYQFLVSQYENIREMANSGGQENLSGGIVKSIQVPVPPLPEQKKIAKILSTWDKAISSTEQLLANSQQQKKALVQQLLSGKKRLLDKNGIRFSGEWKKIAIGKIIKEIKKEKEVNPNSIELLTVKLHYKGVTRSGKFPNATERGRPYFRRYKGELIIGRQNLHNGGIAIVSDECNGLIASNAISSFEARKGVDINFILSVMSTEHFRFTVDNMAGGTGQKEIGVRGLLSLSLIVPDFEEQQKIAAVLSIADQEISALQKKLDALNQEKKALMQQLLTGKRRVKIDDKEVA